MNARQKIKYYKRRIEELLPRKNVDYRLLGTTHEVDTIKFQRTFPSTYDDWFIKKTITMDLAHSIAEHLGEYVEYRVEKDRIGQNYVVTGWVKVVKTHD